MPPDRIKVLIADDSPVTRLLLEHLLGAERGIQVIGTVNDGQAALDFLEAHSLPDVIVMDIHMPRLDGFEATRRIMETRPVPIIICTATCDPREMAIAFRSLEAGALACVEKPVALTDPGFQVRARNLLQTIRLMSEVKVVRRWPRLRAVTSAAAASAGAKPATSGIRFIGVGASTGGPLVLQTILSGLPREFPVPLLIVQHISPGFLPGMVEWLNQTTGLRVQVAAHGVRPLPGHAYLAPDDLQLGVGAGGLLTLTRAPPENGLRPAVSHLFRSLLETCGAGVIGVLLTGMGRDGAEELKSMKDRGACTIAQDRNSSIVYGMPGEAAKLDGATYILAADRIAAALMTEVGRRSTTSGEFGS